MDESFRGLEHGIDERIPVAAMAKMVKFYAQLMQVWGTERDGLTIGLPSSPAETCRMVPTPDESTVRCS